MHLTRFGLAGLLLLLPTADAHAVDPVEEAPAGSQYEGDAFTFHKVQDDIFHAVGTGNLAVGSNGAVIINEHDVLVVDSHMTAAAGWALRQEVRRLTPKPIRYVINTHFHFDHAHGNEVFGPDVEIIAHTFTYEKLASGQSKKGRAYESFVLTLPAGIKALEERLAAADEADKPAIREQLKGTRAFWQAAQGTTVSPPTLTLDKRLVLHRGGREIQLIYSGRGHTGGDVVVFLPKEKVLITGDLLTEGLPYMGDSYPLDWISTLSRLSFLDFEQVLPGHGSVFSGKEKIEHLRAYLRDLWEGAQKLHLENVSAERAAAELDLSGHAEHFPQIDGPGVSRHAIDRIYEILDGED